MPVISTQYSETAREITVTVYRNRRVVNKTITDKTSGLTIVEVYKEGCKDPIEKYIYNKVQ